MAGPEPKAGRSSLIGGIVVGVAVFAIWTLVVRDVMPGAPLAVLPGVLLGLAVAVWIRAADL